MSLRALFVGPDYNEFWKHRDKLLKSKNALIKRYHRLCCSRILYRNNASIEEQTKIEGGRITFPHGLNGILISAGATIGKNCTIFHQVTIGSNTTEGSRRNGSPQIGDNVLIGAGAKIIGNIKIGNNVRIGANCVVVDDVPDNATVVMQKPRVIEHSETRDNTFKSYANYSREK